MWPPVLPHATIIINIAVVISLMEETVAVDVARVKLIRQRRAAGSTDNTESL